MSMHFWFLKMLLLCGVAAAVLLPLFAASAHLFTSCLVFPDTLQTPAAPPAAPTCSTPSPSRRWPSGEQELPCLISKSVGAEAGLIGQLESYKVDWA